MLDHPVAELAHTEQGVAAASGDAPAVAGPSAVLSSHIERMLRAGRPAAARPLLQALKRTDPDHAALGMLEAQLLIAEGQSAAALGVLDRAIAQSSHTNSPQLVDLYLLRGQTHFGLGQFAQALDDTAAAVMAAPTAPVPKLRLGVLLAQIGHFDEAIACLREAVAAQREPAGLRGLAMAYERSGRHAEATEVLDEAIRDWPKNHELRAARVTLAMRGRRFADAIEQAEHARRDGAINAAIFGLMGDCLAFIGRHHDASAAYHNGVTFAPDDVLMQQYAALSDAASHAERVAPPLLRTLFDLVAPGYDDAVFARGCRVPGLIRRTLQCQIAMGALTSGPALDLGCGTGLVALAAASVVGPITGFDVSPMMLAAARGKRIYAELRDGDLLDLLTADARIWPVILAGDSLLYFGALESILAGVRARLSPGGCFIFSLAERCPEIAMTGPGADRWTMTRAGCFVHSRAYVEQALVDAGLRVISIEAETLHHDADIPIEGWIIVAGHAVSGSEAGQ